MGRQAFWNSAPESTGNAVPIEPIIGAATMIESTSKIAVDNAGNIYLPDGVGILKFAPSETGMLLRVRSHGAFGG